MSFASVLALAIAAFIAAPFAAHLLRRKRADEQAFSATRLVPATEPTLRKRSALEDRVLFGARALAIALLALLGATPFVKCSRLALARQGGASVALAIVVDDSLSMRARDAGSGAGETRFAKALGGARDLAAGLEPGDAVAVVLAGSPPRVALAATPNVEAVTAALRELEPSDRATDLEGAVSVARDLLKGLPQGDKRVVVLSDLADGHPDRGAIEATGEVPLWFALPELAREAADCAAVRAEREGTRVRAHVVCTPDPAQAKGDAGPEATATATASATASPDAGVKAGARASGASSPSAAAGRSLELVAARGAKAETVATAALPAGLRAEDMVLDVPEAAKGAALWVKLTGSDVIPEDDATPVVDRPVRLAVGVVDDATSSEVETGGAPPIEQALTALELDVQVKPLPGVPEHADELEKLAMLVVDDVPGLTPQVRRELAAYVERGGTAVLALGPVAASAPLGAGFDPLVPGVVRWGASPAKGVDPKRSAFLGPSAEGWVDLAPEGRTTLAAEALEGAEPLVAWSDGAPLLLRRSIGKGAVYVLGLPLSLEQSDLALRPAFLAMLEKLVDAARSRGGASRVDVGAAFPFEGYADAKLALTKSPFGDAEGPRAIPVKREGARLAAVAPLAGLYEATLDGEKSARVATVAEREIDLRPREAPRAEAASSMGGVRTSVDASPYVALALLAVVVLELFLRTLRRREALPSTP